MGEFEKRIILMIGEGKYDPQRVEYLGRVSDMIDEAEKEFRGFEKEILHLLGQKRHPESEKALKYALHTLQGLNEKWFGGSSS